MRIILKMPLLLWLIVTCVSCTNIQQESKTIILDDLKSILSNHAISGAIVIYNTENDTYYINDSLEAENKEIPASTYKIPHTMIGLESAVIDTNYVFQWDGSPRGMEVWEQDNSLRNAFRYSCVPCYQELAPKIGVKRMRKFLNSLDYPGMQFDAESIDEFWLIGDSEISAYQQVEFLKRLYFGHLALSKNHEDYIKDIMLIDSTEQGKLYGKTGLGLKDSYDVGWFVGFLENEQNVLFFAVRLINENGNLTRSSFIPLRMDIAKKALSKL